jgi:transketolase
MNLTFGTRRSTYLEILRETSDGEALLSSQERDHFEQLDLLYRSLCAFMYNYVPMSGHPGGSISAGRFMSALLFDAMDYDLGQPDRDDADLISFGAGHKATGLYALWALRDEIARLAAPELLPANPRYRLRLEDLLGFRRNPITDTPLFRQFGAKALDGHPTPATPFLRLSTGASGVGVASSLGLAIGAREYFGAGAPRVHVVEGEGGLTPGRVAEALAAAGTASLDNAIVHVDWNQCSIDSNRVCREDGQPGDYVQWTPAELFYLHDWNVISVADGHDFRQVLAAQRAASTLDNGQPTAIVYRTVKGWQYGIEGRASHGAGHALCSDGFCKSVAELTGLTGHLLPSCDPKTQRCASAETGPRIREACYWDALSVVRQALEANRPMVEALAKRLVAARDRLNRRNRVPRSGAPHVETIYELAAGSPATPEELRLTPGASTTLRGELGRALQYLNKRSGGALLVGSADLMGSTSLNTAGGGFPTGFWNAVGNPEARLLSVGGICEDGMAGLLSGISSFGRHLGVGSSYGAFIAPLSHIAARLHAIGAQARQSQRGSISAHDRGLRSHRPQDRRGWTDPRRSAASATLPGELPPRDQHHFDPMGPPGDLAAPGRRPREATRRHRALCHSPKRTGPRSGCTGFGGARGGGQRRLSLAAAQGEGSGDCCPPRECGGLCLRRGSLASPR